MGRKVAEEQRISTRHDRDPGCPWPAALHSTGRIMSETPYRSIAVAAAFSPRFHQVLAEANRVRARFGSALSMIYVGKRDAATGRKFADAVEKLKLPADSAVHYEEGDPATGILAVARK